MAVHRERSSTKVLQCAEAVERDMMSGKVPQSDWTPESPTHLNVEGSIGTNNLPSGLVFWCAKRLVTELFDNQWQRLFEPGHTMGRAGYLTGRGSGRHGLTRGRYGPRRILPANRDECVPQKARVSRIVLPGDEFRVVVARH